jgi:hypothetical protein
VKGHLPCSPTNCCSKSHVELLQILEVFDA